MQFSVLHVNSVNYIGQTTRSLDERVREHIGQIRNLHTNQPTGEHFNLPGHELQHLKVSVLYSIKIKILLLFLSYNVDITRNTGKFFSLVNNILTGSTPFCSRSGHECPQMSIIDEKKITSETFFSFLVVLFGQGTPCNTRYFILPIHTQVRYYILLFIPGQG